MNCECQLSVAQGKLWSFAQSYGIHATPENIR